MAEDGDTKFCSNCKRDIASSNFVMHELHCKRHITLCEHCKEPIPRSELEDHFDEVHAKVPCELCKLEVAKDKIETHKENECSKKPMQCQFCELSYPKVEFKSHSDFCGSRTEPCPLCQQYIMLKDMTRHENSGCTFPEPKPPPARSDPDPFRMEDLNFLLDDADFTSPMLPDFTSNLQRELDRTRGSRLNRGSRPRPDPGTSSLRTEDRSVIRRTAARKKSDVNVERARNLVPNQGSAVDDWKSGYPADMDHDTMLALQMAHEDWQLGQLLESLKSSSVDPFNFSNYEDTSPENMTVNALPDKTFNIAELADDRHAGIPNNLSSSSRQSRQNARQEYQDEDMCIPCEFCETEIPLTTYLEHVESCPFGTGVQNNRNNESSITQSHTRPSIPVINNLHTSANDSTLSVPAPLSRDDLGEEDVLLPCEFCEDVFPADIILQHQSVCADPRAVTPATSSTRVKAPTNGRAQPKRQSDPAPIDFVNDNRYAEETRRNLDDSSDNYFRYSKVPESPTVDKYSPALNRFDEAVTRPPGPRRSARSVTDKNTTGLPIPTSNTSERPPSSSTQRARARLNQLLQEDSPNGASSGATGGARKSLKQGVLEKNTPGFLCSTHIEALKDEGNTRERKTQVSSRTVMTQMERGETRPSRTRPEESPNAAPSRTRQRADNIFSPELRLKPDHNPKPKKR